MTIRDEGLVAGIGEFMEETGVRPTIALAPKAYARLCETTGVDVVTINACEVEMADDVALDGFALFIRRNHDREGRVFERKGLFREGFTGLPEPGNRG